MNFDSQTLELLKFGWGVLVTLCSVAGACVMLWASRHFVRRDEYETAHRENQEKLEAHSIRLTNIEAELRQAPKHADLVMLSHQVSNVSNRLSVLEGQTLQTNNLLSAIHDHLLNRED